MQARIENKIEKLKSSNFYKFLKRLEENPNFLSKIYDSQNPTEDDLDDIRLFLNCINFKEKELLSVFQALMNKFDKEKFESFFFKIFEDHELAQSLLFRNKNDINDFLHDAYNKKYLTSTGIINFFRNLKSKYADGDFIEIQLKCLKEINKDENFFKHFRNCNFCAALMMKDFEFTKARLKAAFDKKFLTKDEYFEVLKFSYKVAYLLGEEGMYVEILELIENLDKENFFKKLIGQEDIQFYKDGKDVIGTVPIFFSLIFLHGRGKELANWLNENKEEENNRHLLNFITKNHPFVLFAQKKEIFLNFMNEISVEYFAKINEIYDQMKVTTEEMKEILKACYLLTFSKKLYDALESNEFKKNIEEIGVWLEDFKTIFNYKTDFVITLKPIFYDYCENFSRYLTEQNKELQDNEQKDESEDGENNEKSTGVRFWSSESKTDDEKRRCVVS